MTDTASIAEKAAKRADELKAAKTAAAFGDPGPARELAAIEAAEATQADADADAAKLIDAAKTGRELADVLAKLAPADVRPLQTFSGRELPKPVLWMDPRHGGGTVLRVGDVAVIGGAGGVGKSFATLALAVAAASPSTTDRPGDVRPGETVGLHVRSGPAVLIGYEDDPVTVAVPEGLAVVVDPEPLMVADYDSPGSVRDGDDWRGLWDGIAALSPSLVIVDPASAALAGVNQNDGGTVRHFVRALAREAVRGGFGVLIVAHSTKKARYGGDPGPGAVAGSAQWHDAARGVLFMRGDGPGRAVIECLKANHGPTGWAVTLEADRRTQDGKPDLFAGWRRTGRYGPQEWAAEQERRKASGNGAARKPDMSEKRGNGVRAKSGPYAPGEVA